ncbi:MAG: PIG-L family deacetylase [Gemmatimonadaceae bacterium]|nr:PIG-L family deacetylase [Gemmatimonadaceae bacterium]
MVVATLMIAAVTSARTQLTVRRVFGVALASTIALASRLHAQPWREQATHVGTTARIMIVGTRPDDEDNALIAWLSRARHIETAYLSLTRGEAGRNVAGAERNATLAVVRTAELLAERQLDGAHQYFTRAYDIGATAKDTLVAAAGPRDSVLIDMVSVIRAFRPHVVIALALADSGDDAARRYTARLLASAFTIAADTLLMPSRTSGRLPAWSVARLFTRVDSARVGNARSLRVDVGEFDRTEGRSYAEIGARIRRLQRTHGVTPAPALGASPRWLRLDSARVGGEASLFGTLDTTFLRLRPAVRPEFVSQFDTLAVALGTLTSQAARVDADSLATRLAMIVRLAISLRVEQECRDVATVPMCSGAEGDLAVSLHSIRERASSALLDAAGIVIDGNVERELVAAGDSAGVVLTVHNGGGLPITLKRLALSAEGRMSVVLRDTNVVVAPSATNRWNAQMRFLSPTYHWWQINGLVERTLLQKTLASNQNPVVPQQLMGEDRIRASSIEATILIAGVEVPVIVKPLAYRSATALRGDTRHPVIGVPETSLLFERSAEYERAGMSVDRLFRVFVQNARSTADTVAVSLMLPMGLRPDSASKTVPLPPFSARNVFFRLQGALPMGSHTIEASAHSVAAKPPDAQSGATREFTLGVVINDYPHIPSQHFVRFAKDRVESLNLRLPTPFRAAYIRGTEDLRPAFQQLRLSVQALDLALVPVADLSNVTAVLIGAGALRSDASFLAVPALRAFMQRGGVVVVLPGGRELSRSPLFPYPVDFRDAVPDDDTRGSDLQFVDERSPLFNFPNVIKSSELESWGGDRNCSFSQNLYAQYTVPLVVTDAERTYVRPSVLIAPVGKGRIVVTSLCLAQQLEGAQAGAAKLLVNMLSMRGAPR